MVFIMVLIGFEVLELIANSPSSASLPSVCAPQYHSKSFEQATAHASWDSAENQDRRSVDAYAYLCSLFGCLGSALLTLSCKFHFSI